MNHCLPAASYFKVNECVRRIKIFYIVAEIAKTRLCWIVVAREVNCKMHFVCLGAMKYNHSEVTELLAWVWLAVFEFM